MRKRMIIIQKVFTGLLFSFLFLPRSKLILFLPSCSISPFVRSSRRVQICERPLYRR